MSISPTSRCLVVGSSDSQSIGYACANALLLAGAGQVMLVGRDQVKIDAAVLALGPKASGMVGDLKQPESMPALVHQAVAILGGLDILVVSGGNGGSEYLGLDANAADSYRLMYNVGVLSPMLLAEAAVPHLLGTNNGTIVMVSSAAAHVPWPDTAPFNYAKAAQNAMIETLAFKYRGQVRVNGVLPACIHTGALDRMARKKNRDIGEYAALRAEAHPMGRNGTPQDVAHAVVYLASPASGFTTGELLKVDGGLHLSNWFNKPKLLAEFQGGTD